MRRDMPRASKIEGSHSVSGLDSPAPFTTSAMLHAITRRVALAGSVSGRVGSVTNRECGCNFGIEDLSSDQVCSTAEADRRSDIRGRFRDAELEPRDPNRAHRRGYAPLEPTRRGVGLRAILDDRAGPVRMTASCAEPLNRPAPRNAATVARQPARATRS